MARRPRGGSRRCSSVLLAVLTALAVIATPATAVRSELVGRPTTGGSLTYGVDSENPRGWCLPEVQLTTGGAQVSQALYETLTVPNADDEFVPYLARSIEHTPDFTEWTISLRDGITFHDGSLLDANAVAQNLDAYRGSMPFSTVLADIEGVAVVDDQTVRVRTRVPWVAFPATLWGNGRLGMVAPAQLADRATCATNLIGTGPFVLQEAVAGDRIVVVRNDRYWQRDRSDRALPYLDRIEFRPVADTAQRLNGLKGRDLDVVQLTNGQWMTDLRKDAQSGFLRLLESDRAPVAAHILLNASTPPFALRPCRLAIAYGTDRAKLTELADELSVPADQPFAAGTVGHQTAPGYPRFDPDRSKEMLEQCVVALGTDALQFTLATTPDAETQALAGEVAAQLAAVGIQVDRPAPAEPGAHLERVMAGDYQATLWRSSPSLDPDGLLPWWHSRVRDPATGQVARNPLNVGRFEDAIIDRALERGRSEADRSERAAAYEQVGRRLAKQAYVVWTQFVDWVFAANPDVRGLAGPSLPNGDRRGLPPGGVQPVLGVWLER